MAAWIVIMFVGVLLHELGHALTARAFGQQPAIALHGLGGVTVWQPRGDIGPGKRAVITLAGPLVGLVIGLPALAAGRGGTRSVDGSQILRYVWYVNLVWAIFNLLPMLPLDGGRIMASLLELVFGKASLRAAYILSIVVAVLIGLLHAVGRGVHHAAVLRLFHLLERAGAARSGPARAPRARRLNRSRSHHPNETPATVRTSSGRSPARPS